MRRYTSVKPRAYLEDWYDRDPFPSHLTVYEPDEGPFFTGLLDAQGNELYAYDEREPIGFRIR